MPEREPNEPVTDAAPDTADSLSLAEAEAAAAEAEAKAATARAEAIRLREAALAAAASDDEAPSNDDAPSEQTDDTDVTSDQDDPVGAIVSPQAKRSRSIWQPVRWIAGTLAVLAIAALVTASVLMVRNHHRVDQQQDLAAEYIAAGRQGVVTLMSLNFSSIDEDIQRILDNSTGEFRKDFEGKAKDFSQVAKESKVITEASATAAAIESMNDNDAVVLVAASTKVTNKAGAIQDPRSWRLAIHLVREGDQIKMSKVDFAP